MRRYPKILASGHWLLAAGLLFPNISQTPAASSQKLFVKRQDST
jgi:hypothetical protein